MVKLFLDLLSFHFTLEIGFYFVRYLEDLWPHFRFVILLQDERIEIFSLREHIADVGYNGMKMRCFLVDAGGVPSFVRGSVYWWWFLCGARLVTDFLRSVMYHAGGATITHASWKLASMDRFPITRPQCCPTRITIHDLPPATSPFISNHDPSLFRSFRDLKMLWRSIWW